MYKSNFLLRLLIIAILSVFVYSYEVNADAETPPSSSSKEQASFAPMLKMVMPAVVNVTVLGEINPEEAARQMPKPRQPSGPNGPDFSPKFQDMGSGIIIDAEKGHIITNAHVIKDAKNIMVTLSDGRRFKAKEIGADKATDIALLQIKAKNLQTIKFADSDALQVGDFVAAIGNPFGLNETVTSGVISALNRNDLGIEGYENFIQTDAPINPGNSGGALVNLKGELVGMNTAIIGPISGNVGIGFAIPSNMVKSVAQQLIKSGKVERSILGVMVQDLTPDLADAFNVSGSKGALITSVTQGSPGQKAGLQEADIVIKINGSPINDASQLRNMVGFMPPGSNVTLEVKRGGKLKTISAKTVSFDDMKRFALTRVPPFLDGVRLTNYDQLVPGLGPVKGVGVLDVDETSDAFLDGLRPGDVIMSVNNQAVTNVNELLEATSQNPDRLLLKIGRDNGVIFLVISLN